MSKSTRPQVSRKQENRVEREKAQRRIVIFSTIAVLVLVVLVLGYGFLSIKVLQPNQAVATVDGEKITLKAFQTRVRYDRYQLIQNITQLQQYNQMFGTDPTTGAGMFDSQIQKYLTQLNDSATMGDQAIQELINDIVISKKAAEMGITVSEAEVDKAIQEAFGFFKDGTPTAAPTAVPETPFATATYTSQQLTLAPATATPTEAPSATESATATAEAVETTPTSLPPTEAATPTVDPNAPTATPEPTATPYTQDAFQQTYDQYVAALKTDAELNSEDFRSLFRSSLLYKKVNAEVNKNPPTTEEWVWARHILVATEEEANTVEEALKAGGDFAALAAQYSTDSSKDSGGDLGWFTKGQMVAEFENAAFALTEIGQISDPVKSEFGYHIIQLLGREERPVTSDRLTTVESQIFSDWLEAAKATMNIQTLDNWQNKVPTIPAVPTTTAG